MSDRQQLTSSLVVAGSLGHFCLSHEDYCILINIGIKQPFFYIAEAPVRLGSCQTVSS
jgi:hypothetical protein